MCVVELDGGLLGQLSPIAVMPKESANQIRQRTGDQKVFLHEAQILARSRGVIGIQHTGQRFGLEGPAQCGHEIPHAKLLEIEVIGSRRGPEAKGADGFPAITYDWTVIRNAEQSRWTIADHLDSSVAQLEGDVQLDFHFLVMATDLPWIAVPQPVVGILLLPAVHKRLTKH